MKKEALYFILSTSLLASCSLSNNTSSSIEESSNSISSNITSILSEESSNSTITSNNPSNNTNSSQNEVSVSSSSNISYDGNPIITFNLSNNKQIRCELYPDIAPITVANILNLVDSHFYDGTIFHRVIPNFVIQGGGFYIEGNTIYQKQAQTIIGEFDKNGIPNSLSHTPGVLSMARATDYNSGSSQFFICVDNCLSLNSSYAAFGKTIDEESLNVAIEMSKVQTTTVGGYLQNFPIAPVTIINVTRDN